VRFGPRLNGRPTGGRRGSRESTGDRAGRKPAGPCADAETGEGHAGPETAGPETAGDRAGRETARDHAGTETAAAEAVNGQADSVSGRGDSVSGRGDSVSGRGDSVSGRGDSVSGRGDTEAIGTIPGDDTASRATGDGAGPVTLDLTSTLAADREAAAASAPKQGAPSRGTGRRVTLGRAVTGPIRAVKWDRLATSIGPAWEWVRARPPADSGRLAFAIVTVLPALVLMAWLVPGAVLLLAGRFLPVPMVLISVPLAAALAMLCLRDLPDRWAVLGRGRQTGRGTERSAPGGAAIAGTDEAAAGMGTAETAEGTGGLATGTGGSATGTGGSATGTGGSAAGIGESAEGTSETARSAAAGGAKRAAAGEPGEGAGEQAAGAGEQAAGGGETAGGGATPGAGTAGDAGEGAGTSAVAGTIAAGPSEPAAGGSAPAAEAGAHAARVGAQAAPAGGRRGAGRRSWAAWWGLGGTVAVAAVFAAWQILVSSSQIIVSRDPGAYLQFGYWIAQHGSLPVPGSLAAFGGAHPGLTFSSFGFASHGGALVPQFMAGLPITLSAGLWAHGVPGAALVSPILGALAILAVGGLTGRLAGPQWAPAGALLLALTVPEIYTSRSAFSQPLVQALLFAGLCLVIDSLCSRHSRVLAALGGLALGLTALADVGSLVVLLPAIVFAGALLAARRPQAVPFAAGLLAGAGFGVASGFVLAGSMMGHTTPAFSTIGILAAVFAGVTIAGAAVSLTGRVRQRVRRALAARPLRWLPDAGAVAVAGLAIAFAIRPYVQTVRGRASPYIAALQRIEHLPVDPGRLYAENSLQWVIWYLGLPALLLGVVGLAVITRRCLRALFTGQDRDGSARLWALPAGIIGWGFIYVLWQPGTSPDQPWASRRLVPVLLPGLVVLAIWISAWLTSRAREQGAGSFAVPAATACFVVALAVPPASITFDIGPLRPTEPSVRLALTGIAFRHTGSGEFGAVRLLCGALPARSSVLILDRAAAGEFAQVVRGLCGVPAGVVAGASQADVTGVINGIGRAGRRAVLLASQPAELAPYQAPPRRVVALSTQQDAHLLAQPPTSTWPVHYELWMSTVGGTFGGS